MQYNTTDFISEIDYLKLISALKYGFDKSVSGKVKTKAGEYTLFLHVHKVDKPVEHFNLLGIFNYRNEKDGTGGFSIDPPTTGYDDFCGFLDKILQNYDKQFTKTKVIEQTLDL